MSASFVQTNRFGERLYSARYSLMAVNTTMLHRPKEKTPRLKGDRPIFRRHYRSLFHVDPAESPDYYRLYLAWLRFCGVDPKTGKMTDKGLAVFKSLLDQENVKRGSRRRPHR